MAGSEKKKLDHKNEREGNGENRDLNDVHAGLQKTVTQFKALFEQASDGIFVADMYGKYLDVNTAGYKMLGYDSKDGIIGKTILDLIPEEQASKLEEVRKELLETASTHISEWSLKKKDGSYLPVEVSAKILEDGRWQGIVRDISDKHAFQSQLVESEQKFRGMVENIQDAVVMINSAGVIEYINLKAQEWFQYTPAELEGKLIEVLIPERFRSAHIGHRMKYNSHPQSRPMGLGLNLFAKRKDGSEFPVDISLSPFELFKKMYVAAFIRDLSDRKRFEAREKFLADTSRILIENDNFNRKLQKIARQVVPFLADFCFVYLFEERKVKLKSICHRDDVSDIQIRKAALAFSQDLS